MIDFEGHIVLDLIKTWPQKIIYLLESSKEDCNKYIDEEKRINILAKRKAINQSYRTQNRYKAIWESLENYIEILLKTHKIIGFHCTRLMDYEIDDVIKNGLVPLNRDFSNQRITKLYKNGFISKTVKDKLINKEELSAHNREGILSVFHCISTLRWEMGLYEFFKYWGGEAIYSDFKLNSKLQSIGIPCIVVASINTEDLNTFPSLSKRMIYSYLKNPSDEFCFDSFLTCRVKVLSILQRNDEEFNSLTNIESWDEKIE